MYLQNLALIPPRTSPVKFARSPCTDSPGSRHSVEVFCNIDRNEESLGRYNGSPPCRVATFMFKFRTRIIKHPCQQTLGVTEVARGARDGRAAARRDVRVRLRAPRPPRKRLMPAFASLKAHEIQSLESTNRQILSSCERYSKVD